MVSHARKAAHAYANVGVETGAMSASPHQLIVMLFDGARVALKKAAWAIEQGDVAAKGRALSKAIDIIELGLRAGLDAKAGGEIAERLDTLYEYMVRTLVRANLRGDAALVAEVDTLLDDIGTAWKQIGATAVVPANGALQPQA